MTMITKILNNDYVLNKVMSFLGAVLVVLGFTSCGDEEDEKEPYRAVCLYGVPSVDFAVRGEIAGLVTDSVGNPIENINVRVGLVKQDGTLESVANRVGVTGEDGKYKTIVAYFESFVYYGEIPKMDLTGFKNNFPSYMAIATDSTGVYENDTLYIDYVLNELKGDEYFNYTSTATANFTLHKKASEAK